MKIAFSILIIIHGLIHLLGFIKGFSIREVKELSLPISKSMGALWLLTFVLFLLYGVLQFTSHQYAWLIGFISVVLSQLLIIVFWKDAKLGTIPNIPILIISIMSFGSYLFHLHVDQEVKHLLSKPKTSNERVISEKDIEELPIPVKNWLRKVGIIGKPLISSGKVSQKAQMKIKPDQKEWMDATAFQYSIIDEPAFIWTTNVTMNRFLSFQGRDKFEEGKGEMLIKVNSLFNVIDEKGDQIDEGSIQRFLGEMVWFPSLALSQYISWERINDSSAKATMEYKGTKGSGTFHFNSDGDVIKFTTMRFMGSENNTKRHLWTLTVNETNAYNSFNGIRVPVNMEAKWSLESGDWTWLKLKVENIEYTF